MHVTRRVNEIFPVFAGNTDHKTLINIFFICSGQQNLPFP